MRSRHTPNSPIVSAPEPKHSASRWDADGSSLRWTNPESARRDLESAVSTEFSSGSARISLWAQAWLARTQFALGAWDEALSTVEGAGAEVDRFEIEIIRPLVHWSGAQIHALRGNWELARDHVRRAYAGIHAYEIMYVPALLARAQVAEAAADYAEVLVALAPLTSSKAQQWLDEPGFWPWVDLYANALVMVGRADDADAFLQPHEQTARRREHRSAAARLGYVRGRIHGARGELDSARESFDAALLGIETLPLPYDRARINFAYGQTLRRAGETRRGRRRPSAPPASCITRWAPLLTSSAASANSARAG